MVSASSALSNDPRYRYYGGSVTFTHKGQNSDGTYEVEFRHRQTTYYCHQNNWGAYACYYGNCGRVTWGTIGFIAKNFNNLHWCHYEGVTKRKLNSNRPFAIRYPSVYNYDPGQGYWIPNVESSRAALRMMAHVDLGTRSDTGETNRAPITTIVSVLRVTRNCPRSFNISVFDPDGDRVRCRVPTSSSTYECGLCGLTSGFSLDQDSCSLQYTYSTRTGFHPVELMVEDFPNKHITLSYSNGYYTSKNRLSSGRRKRQLPTTIDAPTTAAAAPITTTDAPITTTDAPITTTAAPITTTAAPITTTAAPITTTDAPITTTDPPITTTAAPITTTDAPITTTAAPITTTDAPITTTDAPITTTAAPITTTDAPITTTAAPITTTAAPITTTDPPITTTDAPITTTAAPTTSGLYQSSIAPLSKLPLQFSVYVDSHHAHSCLDGDYFPMFLLSTPPNGVNLCAFVNQILEIKVVSTAQYSTYNQVYQSELRCVTVDVVDHAHSETAVTCNETTITVEVEKSYLIRRNEGSLHLNDFTDPSCNLTTRSNRTHLVAVISLNTCGTLIEEDEDNIIFKNEITSADPNQIISRKNDVEIAFSCVYPKRSNVTLGFSHKNPYAFTEKGFGAFTFQFEFFESQRFRKQKDASTYPVEVYLKQMIFMQIEATISIPNIELFVESCKATPYDNPNSRISYTIIENGCVRDTTVQVYPSSRSQFRFGMQAFEFIGVHEEVYISCSVILCETGIPGTRCSQGCIRFDSENHRGKREAVAQSSSHSISQGPLHLPSVSNLNLDMNIIFIVVCLLVCAVVVYRSRRSKAKYQPLQTSETD
ncbi:hypothetical protein PAMA_000878 [Pampus argenteus]